MTGLRLCARRTITWCSGLILMRKSQDWPERFNTQNGHCLPNLSAPLIANCRSRNYRTTMCTHRKLDSQMAFPLHAIRATERCGWCIRMEWSVQVATTGLTAAEDRGGLWGLEPARALVV